MIDFKDYEQPGILCLIKCVEVIKYFLDKQTCILLDNLIITSCKRFYYGKYLPKRYYEFEKLNILENELLGNQEFDDPKSFKLENLHLINLSIRKMYSSLNSINDSNDRKRNEQTLLDFLVPECDKFLITQNNKKKLIYTYLLVFNRKSKEMKEKQIIDYVFYSNNLCKLKIENFLPSDIKTRIAFFHSKNYESVKERMIKQFK